MYRRSLLHVSLEMYIIYLIHYCLMCSAFHLFHCDPYREFEAEVSFIPVEDHSTILSSKNKCFSGCNKCINYDSPLEAPGTVINEKGASVMATYSNIESEYWERWRESRIRPAKQATTCMQRLEWAWLQLINSLINNNNFLINYKFIIN